jgi:hypothetical protein
MWSRFAVALLIVALPAAAAANVIWPAAILTERLLAWWVIGVSLVIEFVFVRAAFKLPPVNAAWATLAANGLSAAIGLFVVPALGVLFAAGLHHSGIGLKLNWEDFGPADWAVTFIMAVAFNLAIELATYRFGFKLPVGKRAASLILLANVVTVGLALISLAGIPHRLY